MPLKVVIIGGDRPGIAAAERLRQLDSHCKIIILDTAKRLPGFQGLYPCDTDDPMCSEEAVAYLGKRLDITVYCDCEVVMIDGMQHELTVANHAKSHTFHESYHKLILSDYAQPKALALPGSTSPRVIPVCHIEAVPDLERYVERYKPHRVAVVGASTIGLQATDYLWRQGLQVSLIEKAHQVIPAMDRDTADVLLAHLRKQDIDLRLGAGVRQFDEEGSGLKLILEGGLQLHFDLALLTVPERSLIRLAHEADLRIGVTGRAQVNPQLQTSDPDIYAIGEAAEFRHHILDKPVASHGQASPANQARLAAEHVMGRKVAYQGTEGTLVVNVCDLTVAMTGVTGEMLTAERVDHEVLYVYPEGNIDLTGSLQPAYTKILFSKPEGRLLGVQVAGTQDVDKRLDILTTAIRGHFTVYQLKDLELTCTSSFPHGRDPLNLVGQAAALVLNGDVRIDPRDELKAEHLVSFLSGGTPVKPDAIPGAVFLAPRQANRQTAGSVKQDTQGCHCILALGSDAIRDILGVKKQAKRVPEGGFVVSRSWKGIAHET